MAEEGAETQDSYIYDEGPTHFVVQDKMSGIPKVSIIIEEGSPTKPSTKCLNIVNQSTYQCGFCKKIYDDNEEAAMCVQVHLMEDNINKVLGDNEGGKKSKHRKDQSHKQVEWDRKNTMKLLKHINKNKHDLSNKYTNKKTIWKKIHKQFMATFPRTGSSIVEHKWRSLKTEFVKYIFNEQTGIGNEKKPYWFEEVAQILGKKRVIKLLKIFKNDAENVHMVSDEAANIPFTEVANEYCDQENIHDSYGALADEAEIILNEKDADDGMFEQYPILEERVTIESYQCSICQKEFEERKQAEICVQVHLMEETIQEQEQVEVESSEWNNEGGENKVWNDENVVVLLSLIRKYQEETLDNFIWKKDIWDKVQEEMKGAISGLTGDQVRSKFEHLRKAYTQLLLGKQSDEDGDISEKCWFDLLQEVLGSELVNSKSNCVESTTGFDFSDAFSNSDEADAFEGFRVAPLWNSENTYKLLQLIKKFNEQLWNKNFKKKKIWTSIHSEMLSNMPDLSVSQVEAKWKSLKRSFIRFVNGQNEGKVVKRPEFLKDIGEVLGYDMSDANLAYLYSDRIKPNGLNEEEVEGSDPIWNSENTLRLLENVRKCSHLLAGRAIRKKKIWTFIRNEMSRFMPSVTTMRVEYKWKNLKRAYVNYMMKKQNGARHLKKHEFFDEIAEIVENTYEPEDMASYIPELEEITSRVKDTLVSDEEQEQEDETEDLNQPHWNTENTMALLEIVRKCSHLLSDKSIKKKLWTFIRNELSSIMPGISSVRAEYKWRALRKSYLNYLVGKEEGREVRKQEFFDQVAEIVENTFQPPGSAADHAPEAEEMSERVMATAVSDEELERPEEMEGVHCQSLIVWSTEQTRKLLEIVKKNYRYLLDRTYKKKILWARLHQELSKTMPEVTMPQVMHKWRNLKRAYRNYITHVQCGYRNAKKHECFDEIAEILSMRFDQDTLKKYPKMVTAEELDSSVVRWNKMATLKFCQVMKQYYWDLTATPDPRLKRAYWLKIRRAMLPIMPNLKLHQLKKKWVSLRKYYLKYAEDERSGLHRMKIHDWFIEMADMAGDGRFTRQDLIREGVMDGAPAQRDLIPAHRDAVPIIKCDPDRNIVLEYEEEYGEAGDSSTVSGRERSGDGKRAFAFTLDEAEADDILSSLESIKALGEKRLKLDHKLHALEEERLQALEVLMQQQTQFQEDIRQLSVERSELMKKFLK